MKVRVFVQGVNHADDPVFCGSDHRFPGLPSIGQAVRFTDHRHAQAATAPMNTVRRTTRVNFNIVASAAGSSPSSGRYAERRQESIPNSTV